MQRKEEILYTIREIEVEGEMRMGTEHRPEQEKKNYSFMQESIKEEGWNWNKTMKILLRIAGQGILFGLAACIGFFAMKPWAETTFLKESEEIEIPQDDEIEEVLEPEGTSDAIAEELTMDDYQQLNAVLGNVVADAKKCMVQIKGIRQDESWEDEQNVTPYDTSGVIIADNGRELLILAQYSSMKNAQLFQVEFFDNTLHEAAMKQKDGKTDTAIFSVAKTGISESTMNAIKKATLGNSNILTQGSTLIAIGTPFGCEDGIGYGTVSSVNQEIIRTDGKYRMIVTDMPGVSEGNGAIFDVKGYLVGIIDAKLLEKESAYTLSAIGISSIKSEIELMSNGKNVPYVGVIGTMVTKEMSEIYGIPEGLYVKEVEVDSPAMKAGIQNGDVLLAASGETINSLGEFRNIIIGLEAGETVTITGQRRATENYVDVKFSVTVGIKQ